ncbi:MAG TPA: GNAT family N-acetyltransferase [Anaerolineae bacterium]|nr:GNAT family N-acetyltransferase [Anaerolineae bacterium]
MSTPTSPTKIEHLLNPQDPTDALRWYYAHKRGTQLFVQPENNPTSYLAFSRIGWDLFRFLLTYHFPPSPEATADLLYTHLSADTSLWIIGPATDYNLLSAFFTIQSHKTLHLYTYDHGQSLAPHINVLVQRKTSANGFPQFYIEQPDTNGELTIAASATLNWQSPHFAELNVQTEAAHRRRGWGRAVVAALTQYVLAHGRTPLYAVVDNNAPSHRLATTLGYRDTGYREMMLEATLRPQP